MPRRLVSPMNKSPLFLFIIAVVSGILAVFLVLRLFASADAGVRIDKSGEASGPHITPSATLPGGIPNADPLAKMAIEKPLKDEVVKSAVIAAATDNVLPTEWLDGTLERFEVLDETTVQPDRFEQGSIGVKCYIATKRSDRPEELDQRIVVLRFTVKRVAEWSWKIVDGPYLAHRFVVFRARLASLAESGNSPLQNESDVSHQDPKSYSLDQMLMNRIQKSEPCPYFDDDSKWQEMISAEPELIVEDTNGKSVKNDTEHFQELLRKETPVLVACETRQATGGERPPKLIVKLLQ
jgi:hypothetical protein